MQQTLQTFYQNLEQYYAAGDVDQMERFLLETEAQYRENTEGAAQIGIAVYNELGSLYRGISRYDASISSFQHARQLVEKEIGTDSVQYATVLNNMAGTCRLMGHFDDALQLFHMAEQIYAHAGEEQSYAYASVLNNMSLVYRELEDLQPAIEYLEKALAIIQTMPNTQQEIAITYNNLAAMYRLADDTEKAKHCVNLAIEFFEQCREEENVHYAAGLNSLAGFLYAEHDDERALELYQKSAQYTKRFFGENIEYGITCRNMYWVYERLGKRTEAVQTLEKAREIFARVLGEDDARTCTVADDLRRLKEGVGA